MKSEMYYEEQKLAKWLRVVIVVSFMPALFIFAWGLIQQLVYEVPWGNNPMSNEDLIFFTVLFLSFLLLIQVVLYNSKLITKVYKDGIYFQLKPFHLKQQRILFSDIESFETRKYSPMGEFGGYGIRYGGKKRGKAYNMDGKIGLQFYLKNGKKILLGTQKSEEFESVLRKIKEYS